MSARLSFALVLLVMATSRFAIATRRLPTSYGIYLACRCTSGSRPASTTAPCSTPTCCGKSDAGFPDVAIPPHLLPVLAGHLSKCVGPRVIRCCFRARAADIWRRPRCTGSSTRPATWPAGPIFGSTKEMTFGVVDLRLGKDTFDKASRSADEQFAIGARHATYVRHYY
jgi:hypothetical protein